MTIAAKYLKAGFRFFFRPDQIIDSNGDKITNPSKGFLDLGVVTALTPGVENNTIELRDTRGGTLQRVAREVTEINESYTGTFADFNQRNLLSIYGAGRLQDGGSAGNDVLYPGEYFGTDNKENDVLFLGSTGDLDAVHDTHLDEGSPPTVYSVVSTGTHAVITTITWTEDVHYEVDYRLGYIKILNFPGTHVVTNAIGVAYSSLGRDTTSADFWVLDPQSAGGIIEGRVNIEIGWNGNTERLVRKAKASINVSSIDFTAEDYSTYQMEFAILNDGTVGSGVGKVFNI